MYVRDHARPELHAALGLNPTDYDFTVFRITSEISKQVFPLTLDLENPRFHAGLEKLRRLSVASEAAKRQGGIVGRCKQLGFGIAAVATFAKLYLLPTKKESDS